MTIEWLIKNTPNNNGRVGLKGLSYEAFYAAAGLIDSHPALKAVSPQAPESDWLIGDGFIATARPDLCHGDSGEKARWVQASLEL
jgi:predicted acyl esterase